MKKLSKMKEEASMQEQQMEELVQELTKSGDLDPERIESTAEETAEKVSKIMETWAKNLIRKKHWNFCV
jgi:polyhydroxyalkanoate synthesis regulator phasin